MTETRVYLGDGDTWDMAHNCTVKVLDEDGKVCFEIDIETLMSRSGVAELFLALGGWVMTTGMSSEQPQSQRRLAEVSWSADDVQTLRPDWDDERCIQFLEDNEEDIQCAMIARGWDAMSDILRREEHRQ